MGAERGPKVLGRIPHRWRCTWNDFGRMTVIQELEKSARAAIIDGTITTVEKKHYDPKFDRAWWRSAVEAQRSALMEGSVSEFEAALSDLVREFGTPDSGFFHENSRKKVPKGIGARFQ